MSDQEKTLDAEPVTLKVIRAFQPGDVVLLELDVPLPMDARERVIELLREQTERTGVKFILLLEGMRVAAREEVSA